MKYIIYEYVVGFLGVPSRYERHVLKTDKDKIKEVIRYMKVCIEDAKKYCTAKEYKILKDCYKYPLKVLVERCVRDE